MCINWGAGGVARSDHKGSEIVDTDSALTGVLGYDKPPRAGRLVGAVRSIG